MSGISGKIAIVTGADYIIDGGRCAG